MKILIVEDEPLMRKIIRRELINGGYEVVEAASGAMAVEILKEGPLPELITLDVEMPGMNGFATLKKIQKLLGGSSPGSKNKMEVPVVFLSSRNTLDDRRKGFQLGAADYVTKPVTKGRLLKSVDNILKPQNRLKGLTVLVVDDSRLARHLLTDILMSEGLEVMTAVDGVEAFEILNKQASKINVVITDLAMPRMEGDELCRCIRTELDLKHLPVIVLTGTEDRKMVLELFKSGATDYLAKPFEKEELLARLNVHLELEQTLAQLNAANKTAAIASRAKTEFLANISHEIRTPLNAVIGLVELCLKTELTSKQLDYLTKVKGSSHDLLGILNDVLDFSRIESGDLEMEAGDFNLGELLEDISSQISRKAEEKGLELILNTSPDIPLLLAGDSIRLSQVLQNLGSNAVKFTEKGEIIISTEIDTRAKNLDPGKIKLKFTVKDTGIGIKPDQINELFQSFSQADGSYTRKYGGSGLGLAICQKLTKMMNGDMSVQSWPGKGSSFIATAVFEIKGKGPQETYEFPKDLEGLRVLIIDDNASFRRIAYKLLSQFPVETVLAPRGKKGLEEMIKAARDEKPFDLIIIDRDMPDLDGIETMKLVQEVGLVENTPAILMAPQSAIDKAMTEVDGTKIKGFLLKPVSKRSIYNAILDVFGENGDNNEKADTITRLLQPVMGAKILLVEDNSINQQVAVELLENGNFAVTVANNGKEAVDAVLSGLDDSPEGAVPFDVVLMDLQMPEMDGYVASTRIREKVIASRLPIIALTAHAMSGEKEKCTQVGMNDFLTKPIQPDLFFKTLVKWIKPGKREIPKPRAKQKDTGKQVDLPLKIPGIDIETGLKTIGGNRVLYRKLLFEFVEDYENVVKEVRDNLAAKENENARRTAHTIKGISGNIGAAPLLKASKELELALKSDTPDNLEVLVNEFDREITQALESIKGLQPEVETRVDEPVESGNEIKIDLAQAGPVMKELAEYLKEGDTEAEDCIEVLKPFLKGSVHEKQLIHIGDQINKYLFKEALGVLEDVAGTINLKL